MAAFLPSRYRQLPDVAYDETEEILAEMIAEIESVYGQAYEELHDKADDYVAWFMAEDQRFRQKVIDGEATKKEWQDWRMRKMMTGLHWYKLQEVAAADMANSNGIAYSIINGFIPEVYALNANWTVYWTEHSLEIDTSFELFNAPAIERLIRDHPDVLPKASVNIPLDMQWNKQNMTSALMQSIIQGESPQQLADRLASITDMNQTSAIRNARTMITSAQNGARQDMYERNESMGIIGKKTWIATLDFRTRDSHRVLDGVQVGIHDKFPNGLMEPGDPSGEPAEIYNCRCKSITMFPDQNLSKFKRDSKLGDMSYDEWKNAHGDEPEFKSARNATRDRKMWHEYKDLLKKQVPSRFDDFQNLKYRNKFEWKKMISDARKARRDRRNGNGK